MRSSALHIGSLIDTIYEHTFLVYLTPLPVCDEHGLFSLRYKCASFWGKNAAAPSDVKVSIHYYGSALQQCSDFLFIY
jgi:hypothetical protein